MGKLILLFFRLMGTGYFWLPYRLRDGVVLPISFLLRLLKFRLKVIRANLELAFPGQDAASVKKKEALTRAAYRHLSHLIFEISMLFGSMRNFVLSECELRGKENWEEAKKRGKGVVFLSSHVGNWEVMAATGGLNGIEVLLVTKHLKPEWLHQAIEQGRAVCHISGTYEPRTMRDVLSFLKKNGTVGFVLDQYAGPPVGVRVPVFGVPVSTSPALATLVKRTQAPVLPVVNYRLPNGKWVVEIQKPLEWISDENPHRELAVNTAHYAKTLEAHILAYPEQWLWTHRRFKGDLSPLRDDEWLESRVRR